MNLRKHLTDESSRVERDLTQMLIAIAMASGAMLLLNACSLKWQSSDTFDREMSMIETVQRQAGVVDLDSYTKREKIQLDNMLEAPAKRAAIWEK